MFMILLCYQLDSINNYPNSYNSLYDQIITLGEDYCNS